MEAFFANKISEILENTDPCSWRHCDGKHSLADVITNTAVPLARFDPHRNSEPDRAQEYT